MALLVGGPQPQPRPPSGESRGTAGPPKPAPSPAALNKNLIKCRGRPPPGLGRPDHRAGFLLQTAPAGPGPAVCMCMWGTAAAHIQPALQPLRLPCTSFPACPSDHPTPVFVSPPVLLPPSPFSLSLLLHFLFFSQPGSVCILLLSSSLKQPQFFFMIWFSHLSQSCLLSSGTILLSQRGAPFPSVSSSLSELHYVSLPQSLQGLLSLRPSSPRASESLCVSLTRTLWPALSLCF